MKQKLKFNLNENSLVFGDCKDWLSFIPNNSIDLIYIDPPFFSNQPYETIWGNGFERRSFDDRWKGKVNHYTGWMRDRLLEAHRVLKQTGSILLHCDWHANHHLRFLLDELFGAENFKNEIIWSYKTGGISKRWFGRKHDNIYWYSKTESWVFNIQTEKSYLNNPCLKSHQPCGKRLNVKKDINGKMYRDVSMRDVLEIPVLFRNNVERIGYKTQKPEALLRKLIKGLSSSNGLILDFFGGGGQRRRWPTT